MLAKFKIYRERELLVDVLVGDVPYPAMKQMVLHEFQHPDFPSITRVISDTRKASMNYSLEEIQDFLAFMAQSPSEKDFRWAILAMTPNQTALSMLVSNDPQFKNVAQVFYTLDACNYYLGRDYSESEFDDPDFIFLPEAGNSSEP